MRSRWFIACLLLASGCKDEPIVTFGQRADGLTVQCTNNGDETQECTPDDGDELCENWAADGTGFVLWPPNHKLHRFTVDACVRVLDCVSEPPPEDDTDPDSDDKIDEYHRLVESVTPVRVKRITADELVDVHHGGDGSTLEYDVALIDDFTFELRAERQGESDGSVYRVYYADGQGKGGSCEFMVPHDHGPHGGAIDS